VCSMRVAATSGGATSTPLRDRREEILANAARDRSGLSVEDMVDLIESSTPVRDVARRTLLRALEVGDEDDVDVLGRLVGAVCDDAVIDDVSFLTSQIVKLEPAYVRASRLLVLRLRRRDDGRAACPGGPTVLVRRARGTPCGGQGQSPRHGYDHPEP
jgi:hypothetical protein